MKHTFTLLAFVLAVAAAPQTRNLEIYWIDVEGGASTLFVSPTGESLLFDTGFPGNGDRDAKRIYAAAQNAGLRQIDLVVISHWHDMIDLPQAGILRRRVNSFRVPI